MNARPKLAAPQAAVAALDARWRELEEELARENDARAAREAARAVRVAAESAAALAPRPPPAAPAGPPSEPLRDPVPVLIWVAGIPLVLPDPLIADRHLGIFRTTCAAIKRKATDHPGDARRLAVLLEGALGVTVEAGARAWAHVREMTEGLGSPAMWKDIAALAGKRGWRDRPLPDQPAKGSGRGKGKKALAVKFSESSTDERLRRGEFVSHTIKAITKTKAARTWDDDDMPRPDLIDVSTVLKDSDSETRVRLSKITGLTPPQINAGVRLSNDWDRAALEPKMTANLMGVGGGGKPLATAAQGWADGLSLDVMTARTELHYAQQALILAGHDAAKVIEAVVLRGESMASAGAAAYSDRTRATVHVVTSLKIGLNLLVEHYKIRARKLAADRAAREKA